MSTQLYTKLADGTHIQQLTTQGQGNNLRRVWAKTISLRVTRTVFYSELVRRRRPWFKRPIFHSPCRRRLYPREQ